MSRVLLIVIDGWTSRVLAPALERDDLPVLSALARHGSLDLGCVSIFPSITPAATASIVTGQYPSRHGIAGMSWWNPSTGEVSYYGDNLSTVLRRNPGDFLRAFLIGLNGDRLQAPTLFQLVERQGGRAACFNHLIFRGDAEHEVQQPLLLRLLPSIGSHVTVRGPSWLCLGDFVSNMGEHSPSHSGIAQPFNRFGLDDAGTAAFLTTLPGADALPDFSVAYFADYDFESHRRGPQGALDTLRAVDRRLGEVFDHWGGLDRVLRSTAIALTADHSHSLVEDRDDAAIQLDTVLEEFTLTGPADGQKDDALLVCPNMRAAEIYVRGEDGDTVAAVTRALLQDRRIDQVIWCEPDHHCMRFHVKTRERGSLAFRSGSSGTDAVRDEYGGRWQIDGELGALDASRDGEHVRYGVYPNALERIANALGHARAGRLWVTAVPGCEFSMAGQSVHHGGGSHGTLHELDSLVPLLLAGGWPEPASRVTPRIVDVAPLCAEVLDIHCDTAFGSSRKPDS